MVPEEQEIKNVLWSIHNLKSLGTDAMTAGFYKIYWHIVNINIIHFIQEFFIFEILYNELNEIMNILL